MKKRGTTKGTVTAQQIEKLFRAATEKEDKAARTEIERLNRLYAKRANERIRQLEKAGFTKTAALTRARDWLEENMGLKEGSKRVRFKAKGKSIYSTTAQLEELVKFLNWQTSTPAGERKRRANIIKAMRENGINITDEDEYLDFLDSDAWEEYRLIDSRDFEKRADEVIAQGGKVSDLEKLWNKYKDRKDYDAFKIWDDWERVTKENAEESQ